MQTNKKSYRLYLTTIEKKVLFNIYKRLGVPYEKIREIIEGMSTHLKRLVSKLRRKKTPEEQIDIQFKEEFAKLCEGVV